MLAITIDITWGWWMIPAAITIYFLYYMLLPNKTSNDIWGVGAVVDGLMKMILLIPILLAWLIYLIFHAVWDVV